MMNDRGNLNFNSGKSWDSIRNKLIENIVNDEAKRLKINGAYTHLPVYVDQHGTNKTK